MEVSVAANLKTIIEEKGLKQTAVAAKSGFTDQQFCDMLAGRKIIRAEYIPGIARALGVSVSDLFATEEDISRPA